MTSSSSSPIRRRQDQPRNWFQRIGSWFTFVNQRRLDLSQPVWPVRRTTAWICSAIALSLLLVLIADRAFLELVRSGATQNNQFFEMLTKVGQSDWILYVTGGAILVFTVFTADRFSGALHRVWHRLFLSAYFIFTSVAFSGLITLGLKFVFGRFRPPFVNGALPWEADPFTAGYQFASFPSGHSTTSGALAMALALLFPRFAWLFLLLGLITASSRSFIGVHFPSDVAMGLAIGVGFTWIYARSFARKRLLFHFLPDGTFALRGEGRGHMHRWADLFTNK
ncbi:MAG: phosphatase PAP2 family protein [Salaquimonas sp.]